MDGSRGRPLLRRSPGRPAVSQIPMFAALEEPMNRRKNGFVWKLLLVALAVSVLGVAVMLIRQQQKPLTLIPTPPQSQSAGAVTLPPTMSHLSIAMRFPKTAIASQLENAIPTMFTFD